MNKSFAEWRLSAEHACRSFRLMNGTHIPRFAARTTRKRHRGFSLIELLVVISIMVMLLSLAGTTLTSPASRSQESAERLASAVSLAVAHAAARNRLVWMTISPQEEAPSDLDIRFFHSLDGTNRPDSVKEFRRAMVLENMRITADLPDFGKRPRTERTDRMRDEGILVIKPTGEVFMMDEETGHPMPEGGLRMISEIGLQALRGRSGIPNPKDLAAVQLRGISAHALVYTP